MRGGGCEVEVWQKAPPVERLKFVKKGSRDFGGDIGEPRLVDGVGCQEDGKENGGLPIGIISDCEADIAHFARIESLRGLSYGLREL